MSFCPSYLNKEYLEIKMLVIIKDTTLCPSLNAASKQGMQNSLRVNFGNKIEKIKISGFKFAAKLCHRWMVLYYSQ